MPDPTPNHGIERAIEILIQELTAPLRANINETIKNTPGVPKDESAAKSLLVIDKLAGDLKKIMGTAVKEMYEGLSDKIGETLKSLERAGSSSEEKRPKLKDAAIGETFSILVNHTGEIIEHLGPISNFAESAMKKPIKVIDPTAHKDAGKAAVTTAKIAKTIKAEADSERTKRVAGAASGTTATPTPPEPEQKEPHREHYYQRSASEVLYRRAANERSLDTNNQIHSAIARILGRKALSSLKKAGGEEKVGDLEKFPMPKAGEGFKGLVKDVFTGWDSKIDQVTAFSLAIKDFSKIAKETFHSIVPKDVLASQDKYRMNIRTIAWEMEGVTGSSRDIQKRWAANGELLETAYLTSQKLEKVQEQYAKSLRTGYKTIKDTQRVIRVAAFGAKTIEADADQMVDYFTTLSNQMDMGSNALTAMGHSMRGIARDSKMSGESLVQAIKTTDGLMTNLKRSGSLTINAAENVQRAMVLAAKHGISEQMGEMLKAMSSTYDFQQAAPETRNVLGVMGGADIMQQIYGGTGLQDKSNQKLLADNMAKRFEGMTEARLGQKFSIANIRGMDSKQRNAMDLYIATLTHGKLRLDDFIKMQSDLNDAGMSLKERMEKRAKELLAAGRGSEIEKNKEDMIKDAQVKAMAGMGKTLEGVGAGSSLHHEMEVNYKGQPMEDLRRSLKDMIEGGALTGVNTNDLDSSAGMEKVITKMMTDQGFSNEGIDKALKGSPKAMQEMIDKATKDREKEVTKELTEVDQLKEANKNLQDIGNWLKMILAEVTTLALGIIGGKLLTVIKGLGGLFPTIEHLSSTTSSLISAFAKRGAGKAAEMAETAAGSAFKLTPLEGEAAATTAGVPLAEAATTGAGTEVATVATRGGMMAKMGKFAGSTVGKVGITAGVVSGAMNAYDSYNAEKEYKEGKIKNSERWERHAGNIGGTAGAVGGSIAGAALVALIPGIGAMLAPLGGMLGGMIGEWIGKNLGSWCGPALEKIAGGLGFLFNGLISILTAVFWTFNPLVIAAKVLVKGLQWAGSGLVTAFVKVGEWIGWFFKGWMNIFGAIWNQLNEWLGPFFTTVGGWLSTAWSFISDTVSGFGPALAADFETVWPYIKGLASVLGTALTAFSPIVLAVELIAKGLQLAGSFLSSIIDGIKNWWNNSWIGKKIGAIGGAVANAGSAFVDTFNGNEGKEKKKTTDMQAKLDEIQYQNAKKSVEQQIATGALFKGQKVSPADMDKAIAENIDTTLHGQKKVENLADATAPSSPYQGDFGSRNRQASRARREMRNHLANAITIPLGIPRGERFGMGQGGSLLPTSDNGQPAFGEGNISTVPQNAEVSSRPLSEAQDNLEQRNQGMPPTTVMSPELSQLSKVNEDQANTLRGIRAGIDTLVKLWSQTPSEQSGGTQRMNVGESGTHYVPGPPANYRKTVHWRNSQSPNNMGSLIG